MHNNIITHAPSGTVNRAEREAFFSTELIELLPHTPTDLIMADEFNCVLSNLDCTGHLNSSRTLERLIQGFGLVDVWNASVNRQTYTHYTRTGVGRLDRIYVTEDL